MQDFAKISKQREKKYAQCEVLVACIRKHYYNLRGLRTGLHLRSISMHEIAAYPKLYISKSFRLCLRQLQKCKMVLMTLKISYAVEKRIGKPNFLLYLME